MASAFFLDIERKQRSTMKYLMNHWRKITFILLIVVISFGLLVYLGSPNKTLAIAPEYETKVPAGEPFNITLNIQNTSGSDKALVSLGVENSFLEQGIQVERTVPSYRTVAKGNYWQEYRLASSFLPPLAPDEELPFRLTLIAAKPGHYKTTLTFWVENETRPHYIDIEFEVIEE